MLQQTSPSSRRQNNCRPMFSHMEKVCKKLPVFISIYRKLLKDGIHEFEIKFPTWMGLEPWQSGTLALDCESRVLPGCH